MKRYIITSLLLICSTFLFGGNSAYCMDDNINININEDSINENKQDSYMSILDIYNVKLFNDKVSKQKKDLREQEEREKEKIYNSLFQSKEDTHDTQIESRVEEYNLFNGKKVSKRIMYKKKDEKSNIVIYLLIIVGCIITAIFTRVYYIKRQRKEENNIEYSSYARL